MVSVRLFEQCAVTWRVSLMVVVGVVLVLVLLFENRGQVSVERVGSR